MKTHLAITSSTGVKTACGRGARMDTSHRYTDCVLCMNTDAYTTQRDAYLAEVEAAFREQTPRTVKTLFGNMLTCYQCHGDLFREYPRSLFHYNFVCEGCGSRVCPPTETGMCS